MKGTQQKLKFLNQKGVALLMVLSALVLLTGMVVEFAYNTNVTYNLALNEKDRLQAYYLAQSGINFSKLVIQFDKEAKKLADQASKKLGKTVSIQPLYEMIPINSELLRGLAGLEGPAGEAGEGEVPSEAGEELPKEAPEVPKEGVSVMDVKGAEEFLAFEGDFSAEIGEEDSKVNLNTLFTLAPTQKEYERVKSVLYHLLATSEFEGFFSDRYRDAKELAQSIADYIDRDDARNEGGEDRGREGVTGGKNYKMKNAKLLSVEELIMVPGMTDDILQKLKPYVTVYGKDEKIYACRAKDPLVRSMILAYTESNPTKLEPVKDDNDELLKKAVETVLNSCPDGTAMASELDKVLGAKEPEANPSTTGTGPTTTLTGTTSRTGSTPTQTFTFANMIKNEASIYNVVGIGKVGESEVRVKTILDTSGGSPRGWKELYWRVE